MLAGDPADESTYFAGLPQEPGQSDRQHGQHRLRPSGNLWIATDGQPSAIKVNDGVFGVPTDGPERGHVKQLLSSVTGSEVASLVVGAQTQSMFVSIQHPGEGGSLDCADQPLADGQCRSAQRDRGQPGGWRTARRLEWPGTAMQLTGQRLRVGRGTRLRRRRPGRGGPGGLQLHSGRYRPTA